MKLINSDVFDKRCDEASKFTNEINCGGVIPPSNIIVFSVPALLPHLQIHLCEPLLEQKFLAVEDQKRFFF